MSSKQKKYSSEFKTKVVLDLLTEELTLGQVCSKWKVTNKSATVWKKKFLANASMAFETERSEKDYKVSLKAKEKEVDDLHRQLGKRTAELEWASKKLKSLDFGIKKTLVKSELKTIEISVAKSCEIAGFNRSSYYYKSSNEMAGKMILLKAIDEVYSAMPFYGYRKVHQQLLHDGYCVGVNRVNAYMKELGLKALCPMKKINTSVPHPEHQTYPYLLRDIVIERANQVWSTDITYIRIDGGFVYLAAIIDWYSKAILAWKISNTMDSSLVLGVLNDALGRHKAPEIFNTDQGSQYTSKDHTQLLIKHNIKISMDGKGRATDNIAIERFWRSAKYENIYLHEYSTIRELKKGVSEYIDFYNYKRFHQTLAYRKPMNTYLNSIQGGDKMAA